MFYTLLNQPNIPRAKPRSEDSEQPEHQSIRCVIETELFMWTVMFLTRLRGFSGWSESVVSVSHKCFRSFCDAASHMFNVYIQII